MGHEVPVVAEVGEVPGALNEGEGTDLVGVAEEILPWLAVSAFLWIRALLGAHVVHLCLG